MRMCGRYVLFSPMEQLVGQVSQMLGGEHVRTVQTAPLQPSYNVAPTHVVPIVRRVQGETAIGPAQWGYRRALPSGASQPVFNARGETVFAKPFFGGSVPCVFLMDGWYEWHADPHQRGVKVPHYTRARSGAVLPVAGLCRIEDRALWGTVVTVEAEPDFAWLHSRMPLVLRPGHVGEWLSAGVAQMQERIDAGAEGLMADLDMSISPVSKAVGNVRNNSADLLMGID